MTQIAKIIEALQDGPGTSIELAIETGFSVKYCSAYLSQLEHRGLVVRAGVIPSGGRGRDATIFRLKDQA